MDIIVKFVFRSRIQVCAQIWPMLAEEIPRDIRLSSTLNEATTTSFHILPNYSSVILQSDANMSELLTLLLNNL